MEAMINRAEATYEGDPDGEVGEGVDGCKWDMADWDNYYYRLQQ